MTDDAQLKLSFRLVPDDDRPADPGVLDDIVRLIRQAAATVPKDTPKVTEPADGFRKPGGDDEKSARALQAKIESRIEQASAASQAAVEKRAETVRQPSGSQQLTEQSLETAQQVIAAVQRAMFRAVTVRVLETDAS